MRIRQMLVLGLLAGFLAGCSQPTVPDPEAQSDASDMDGSIADLDPMEWLLRPGRFL